ncbi:MAG: phage late control D family protein [Alphaproteobacteria bacterium]
MPLLPSYFTVQAAFAPLPAPFVQALREIEVETAVGQASMLRLHFDLSRNSWGDLDVVAFDIFRPLLPLTIRVSLGLGIPQVLMNAYVRETRLVPSNTPGASRLEVVALDALGSIMAHIQQPFPWPNCADSVIAQGIFGKYGIVPVVFPTPPTRTQLDTVSNQRDFDATYLFQLARRNSYELYLQPDPVIGRDFGHFHPPLTQVPPQGVLSIDFGTQTNLNSFNVANDMLAPTAVTSVSVDPRTRVPVPAFGLASTEPPMGLEPALTRIIPPPIERPAGTDAVNPAETQAQALARATRSSRAVTATGEVDGLKYTRPLLCGLPVLVRGPGRQHSGLYYVRSVAHRITRDFYTQRFSAWRNAVGLTGTEVFFDPLAAVA